MNGFIAKGYITGGVANGLDASVLVSAGTLTLGYAMNTYDNGTTVNGER